MGLEPIELLSASAAPWHGLPFVHLKSPNHGNTGECEDFPGYWVAVVTQGVCETQLRYGSRWTNLTFRPGTFCCYPPGVHWDAMKFAGSVESVNFLVTPEAIAAFSRNPDEDYAVLAQVSKLPCERDEILRILALEIVEEAKLGAPTGQLYSESLSLALIGRLDGISRQVRTRPAPWSPVLSAVRSRRLTEYVESALASNLSVALLAQVAGMPPSSFAASFRNTFGRTVHRYVLDRRVARARSLLDAELSVAQAALECGFSSQSHFTQAFRKLTGETPGEYLRRRRHARIVFATRSNK